MANKTFKNVFRREKIGLKFRSMYVSIHLCVRERAREREREKIKNISSNFYYHIYTHHIQIVSVSYHIIDYRIYLPCVNISHLIIRALHYFTIIHTHTNTTPSLTFFLHAIATSIIWTISIKLSPLP